MADSDGAGWRDPRQHMLSLRDYTEEEDGQETPVPISFSEAARMVREEMNQELATKVEDRRPKIRLLVSETGALQTVLGEFIARTKSDIEDGRIDSSMEELVQIADHIKKLLFIAEWRDPPMPGGDD